MKLRIDVEKKSYEVTVEFLEDARNGHRHWQPAEIDVPDSVTRPRPPLKLLEDTFCRSPIAGRIAAVLAVNGQAIRKNEPVLVIEAMARTSVNVLGNCLASAVVARWEGFKVG